MSHAEHAVIGGGLAGLCVVEALCACGAAPDTILWVRGEARGASGSPAALLHALPGRSLDPRPGTMWAFARASRALDTWRDAHPELIWRGEMVRPRLPGRLGRRYVSTYQRGAARYPEFMGHALVSGEALAGAAPALARFDEAIVYGPAHCVDLGALVDARTELALSAGVGEVRGEVLGMTRGPHRWELRTDQGTRLTADTVALCVGAGLADWLPEANLSSNGGELMIARPEARHAPLTHAISGGGHVAPRADGAWSIGATYLRPEGARGSAPERPDEVADEALRALTSRLVPGVDEVVRERIWRGTRSVLLDDRVPLCGVLDEAGLFALGALGSKGLLWAPGLAGALARRMRGGGYDAPGASRLERTSLGTLRLDAR